MYADFFKLHNVFYATILPFCSWNDPQNQNDDETRPKKKYVRTEAQRLAHNAAQRARYAKNRLIPGWSKLQAERVAVTIF